jgi:hypothetical protein
MGAMSESGPRASLAPIVVAILSIISLSLLGFVVALWPEEVPRPKTQPVNEAAAPAPQSFNGGSQFAPPPREPRRGTWI